MADENNKTARKEVDWELIERDYRAGLLSVREIAESQGITHTAINKRAKKDGWERDLKAKIQAKADALVSKREVSKAVSTERAETDRVIVEANAMRIADVRMAHRTDIARNRALAIEMLRELENQTWNQDQFEELAELIVSSPIQGDNPDDKAAERRRQKLMEAFEKTLSLPGRVDSMKKLAETLKVLITMEREAYGIASAESEVVNNPLTTLFSQLQGTSLKPKGDDQ